MPYEALPRERAGLAPAAIRYRRLPISHLNLPTVERLAKTLAALAESEAAGRRAVVHCWGGIGRTGAVVGCYLVQQHGLSGPEALAYIAREWQTVGKRSRAPHSPETAAQLAFVRDYQPVR